MSKNQLLSKKHWLNVFLRLLVDRVWRIITILTFLISMVGMPANIVRAADEPTGKYDWNLINVFADNYFSATFLPVNTIDENPDNMWFNAIDDTLPTSIWYEFPAEETISKVGLWQTSYTEPWSYRIRGYEIFVSTDGTTWTSVATNTGIDVPHAYQETSFTPVAAKFVRITAQYPSWEDETYLSYDTKNWIGLDGFQAYDENGDPLINSAPLLLPSHTLTVNVIGNGSVVLDPPGGTYREGQVVQLTASPDAGWAFSGWSGDLSGNATPTFITVNADEVVTATFLPAGKYDWNLINVFADNYFSATFLPVNTIDDNPDNMWFNAIDDTLPTSIWYEFPAEETISMVGLWQTSYDISPWSYRIRDYEIFVSTDGATWTSVAANTGIDVPHAYQETFFTPVAAKFVRITAKYPGWEDETYQTYDTKNWIGLDGFQAYDENGLPLVNSAPLLLPRHTLTVNVIGNGSVILDPPSATYYEGQVVQLAANPDAGWAFSGWSGDLSDTTTPISITVDTDKTITATFIESLPDCYALTLSHTGQGSNPVASPANSGGCSAGQYVAGESITLSGAVPDTGWQISGWSGTTNNASTAATNTVTMPASARTVGVSYTEIPVPCYALTLSHTGQGDDPVASPVKSASCVTNGQYVAGESIALSGADPDTGWQISGWSGTTNNASTAATNTVTMPASAHTAGVIYESTIPPVPVPAVAIHVSETTNACWSSLSGPHSDWKYWHIYGFLMEALNSDGTPYVVVSDADIIAGTLLNGTRPKYPILISLAATCISDATANEIKEFVQAGGHAYVGSTSWTRNELGNLRGASSTSGKYDWSLINVFADNYFSATFLPVNTIDENPDNIWLNAIGDTLPTSIWYEFPAEETISKVGLWQASYTEPWSYRIRDYEVFVSTDGTTWTSVATNTGTDVSHAYQETSFTPVVAKFVKITAKYPSWEDLTYESYDTKNWIGLDGFQAYDGNGDPLIDSSALLSTSSTFALSAEMGLVPESTGLIGTIQKVANDPVVSHLTGTGVRNWLLPKAYYNSGYNHPQHWAQFVTATDATVLLTSDGHPTVAVKDYGAGRFIYHSEFSPLAGYSGYVVDNFEYGFFRKAIEQAFIANEVPLVRLSGWPYPYNAAFKTRHDHFLRKAASDVEAEYGVQGEWLLRTSSAIGGPDWGNLSEILASGALIGSHTMNEYTLDSGGYSAAYGNINQSLNDLESQLGERPEIFVGPGMLAFRDTSKQAIVDNGIKTTGDMSHGPYPNFALKIDTATDYGPDAHWPLLEIPVSRYYALPGETWDNLIYSHMGSMNSTDELAYIEKTVDLTYDLGGVINLYDHIGDIGSLWIHPDVAPFEHYISYSLAKPYVWNTDPLEIYDWWVKRDAVSIIPSVSYPAQDQTQVDVVVSGTSNQGPFALDIAIPTGSGVNQVWLNGNPVTGYRVEGQKLKVNVPAPAQVKVLFGAPTSVTCYALTVSHTGQGSNPVASPDNSTGCSTGQYVAGEIITLSGAAPDSGLQITGWTGTNDDGSVTSLNTVTMPAGNHTASVNYTAPTCYALTLGYNGQGSAPVASPANSTGCSTGHYIAGATITLSGAVPDTGWQIAGWIGTNADGSLASTNTITMPAGPHTANVNYAAPTCYALTLGYSGQGSNPVAAPTNSTGCSVGEYVAGATITLSGAVPDTGWQITGWTGTNDDSSVAGSNTVTMPASTSSAGVVYTLIPLNTTITGKPTNPMTNAEAIFSFTSTKADSTFECKLDGDDFSVCTSPKTYTTLSDGLHTFLVRAINGSEVDSTPASYIWIVNTSTVNASIIADTYVQSDMPTTNFGSSGWFVTDSSPARHMLLKFTVSGVGTQMVDSAKLLLYCGDGSPFGGAFYRVTDTTWGEGTVNWNTAPSSDANSFATLGAVAVGSWYEVDITSLVTGDGTFSLKVVSTSPDGAYYPTKEGTPGLTPQIIVKASTGPIPTVTIDQAESQSDPTSTSPIHFTAIFSEAVTGFEGTDVGLSGTAGATTAVVSGGPTTYDVAVSGMTLDGTVIASIPADVALDASNNGNTASSSTDNSVTYNVPVTCYALTLSHSGQGDDPVASPVKSAACATNGQYVAGENITLSGAAPAAGWQISGWTGTGNNSSTAVTNTVTMPASVHTASVSYTEIPLPCYALTLSHSGQGDDPVASPVKSAACATNGQYVAGESITLSGAAPATGWQISGWTGTGNNSSTAVTNTVTMPSSVHTASVSYTEIPLPCYALTLSHSGQGDDPVASPVKSAACTTNGQYVAGESITLSGAAPATGWQISGWAGTTNNAGRASTNTATMPSNVHTVTVNYIEVPSPVGDIGTNYNPIFTWNKVAAATRYRLSISGPAGKLFDQWYEAANICNSDTCSVNPGPSLTLVAGNHSWWVYSSSPAGGAWSAEIKFMTAAPAAPVITFPAEPVSPATVTEIGKNYTPTLKWNKVSGATYYRVVVKGPGFVTLLDKSSPTASICDLVTVGECQMVSPVLKAGTHSMWVQSYNPSGSIWSAERKFSTSTSLPDPAEITYPSAPVDPATVTPIGLDYTPTYKWNKVLGATAYRLNVRGPGNVLLVDKWVTAADACDRVEANQCQAVSPLLKAGTHSMWIQTSSPAGMTWSAERKFSTNTILPLAPTILYPEVGVAPVTVTSIGTNYTPTFIWTRMDNAVYYRLNVRGPGNVLLVDKWVTAADVCDHVEANQCRVVSPVTLKAGTHSVWVYSSNPAGGVWSAERKFSTSTTLPAKPEITYPEAPISPATATPIGANYNPTFTWNKVDEATYYRLVVKGPGAVTLLDKWYTTADVCPTSTCSQVSPTLKAGTHSVWVLSNNPAGSVWSAERKFSTSTTLPGAATLVSPNTALSNFTPTYKWNKVPEAASYRLVVKGPGSVTVLDKWYTSATVCDLVELNKCEVTSPTPKAGSHTWWVQTYNPAGYTWSGGMTFSTPLDTLPAPVLTYPVPAVVGTVKPIGTDYNPSYAWQKIEAATYYHVVVKAPGNVVMLDKWFPSSSVCGLSECAVPKSMSPTLKGATYSWWMQAYSPKGNGLWTAETKFSTDVQTLPAAVSNLFPTGTTSGTPTYSWNRVGMATSYRLYVKGPYGVILDKWYRAADICDAATCSVVSPSLTSGDHIWWVQTYNSAGYGPWKMQTFKVNP